MRANIVDVMQPLITLNILTHSCNVKGSKEQLPLMVQNGKISSSPGAWIRLTLEELTDNVLLKVEITQLAMRSPCNLC